MENEFQHQTVLLTEAVDALNVKPDGVYIDGTFGRGGHSREILSRLGERGRLIAFDQDPEAIKSAEAIQDERFLIVHQNYSQMSALVQEYGLMGKIDGVLLDIGVSSPQFDDASRGFSFSRSGPLDMRMNPEEGESAAEWLARAEARDIAYVLKVYGEERHAKRIARAIVSEREVAPINDTLQLAKIIENAIPQKERFKLKNPATKSFQAIRIYLNRELEVLQESLGQVVSMLTTTGRLVVISFHSLEDRIVKRFMKKASSIPKELIDLPLQKGDVITPMKLVGKAIKASANELAENARARSAVMRVAEKIN